MCEWDIEQEEARETLHMQLLDVGGGRTKVPPTRDNNDMCRVWNLGSSIARPINLHMSSRLIRISSIYLNSIPSPVLL